MAQSFANRRAAAYRVRAEQLGQDAKGESREDVKRYQLDQAAAFKRAAEAMSPAKSESQK